MKPEGYCFAQKLSPSGSKDIHLKPKTVKLLKKIIDNNLHDIGAGKDFPNRTPCVKN